MRTLKKTLSLVLVVAMVLGLCVVGASAKNAVDDYKDADKIGDAYYEAVGVMTGIGVIKGMGDGILSPTGNYTRAQAAKIITYMLIGEKAAESLVCTTAPFEDVAANHWAAGYIAFCVEQGIINGMSATTFEPEGQLTGFQWAKMLLCAVGFGSQGEFTGNSWSLNTAKVAHSVGVFAGDLAGADHVALQRQQAILYAFNVLTTVPQVTYAPGITGYIEGVVNYKPVTDLGKTLGESVYKLYNVTGVIVDNEAMGNGTTDVAASYTGVDVANIKASTGLDMMYHAAKIWFTGTDAVYTNKVLTTAASGTAVFVTDLAKVTEYCCYDIATGMKAASKLTDYDIGNVKVTGNEAVPYEFDIVDNSAAGLGKVSVTTYAYVTTVGYKSTVNSTTAIGDETVKNAYILTDISAITSKIPAIVIKASEKAYHVFASTATSGAVTKVTKDAAGNYTLTLSDGTKLAPSVFFSDPYHNLTELIDVLTGRDHVTPTYYFVLDTHGHYMSLSEEPFRTVAYFTGVLKPVTEWKDTWSNAVAFVAQFVDVEDATKVEEIPVTKEWAVRALRAYDLTNDRSNMYGYYDITDELYGDASYYPEEVFVESPFYGIKYVYSDNVYFDIYDETWHAVDVNFDGEKLGSYHYDPDTIVFNIAYGAGSSLEIETYVGVDALVKGYAEKHGVTIQSLDLMHVAMTYQTTSVGNKEILTVFGYEDTNANGAYLFVPYTITSWTSAADDYYTIENAAYINGGKVLEELKFEKGYFEDDLGGKIERGFYWYHVDTSAVNGKAYTRIDRVKAQDMDYMTAFDIDIAGNGNYAWINGIPVASDCVFVDTRTDAGTKFDSVVDFLTFCKESKNEYLQIAFMWLGNEKKVSVIYVVEDNLSIADIAPRDTCAKDGWTVSKPSAYEDETVYLLNDEALENIEVGTKVNLETYWRAYYFDEKGDRVYWVTSAASPEGWDNEVFDDETALEVVMYGSRKAIALDVNDVLPRNFAHNQAEIVFDTPTYDVTITNANTNFTGYYKTATDTYPVAIAAAGSKIELEVGKTVSLNYNNTKVAANTYATATYINGTKTVTVSGQFDNAGGFWIADVVPGKNNIELGALIATYRYVLKTGDPVQTQFSIDKVTDSQVAAQDEVTLIGVVPGQATTLYLKHSGKPAGDPAEVAYVKFGGVENQSVNSVETATTEATATYGLNVFCFNKVNPTTVSVANGVNVVEVTWSKWDTQTAGF